MFWAQSKIGKITEPPYMGINGEKKQFDILVCLFLQYIRDAKNCTVSVDHHAYFFIFLHSYKII